MSCGLSIIRDWCKYQYTTPFEPDCLVKTGHQGCGLSHAFQFYRCISSRQHIIVMQGQRPW